MVSRNESGQSKCEKKKIITALTVAMKRTTFIRGQTMKNLLMEITHELKAIYNIYSNIKRWPMIILAVVILCQNYKTKT